MRADAPRLHLYPDTVNANGRDVVDLDVGNRFDSSAHGIEDIPRDVYGVRTQGDVAWRLALSSMSGVIGGANR